ncbi:hypothetical protein F2Q68_00043660 [Brassica cretica]|uniref:Uncharacterized protein n=2 Tax=Brassica cretica TaxID=69181 RepID=A0A3N6RBW0_BRACR|nr:hypothetical protein F2Q68_00043660 [Brassica cretica]KAF3518069.1 hypothetical protein DY000_02059452 [Brassica cretica]
MISRDGNMISCEDHVSLWSSSCFNLSYTYSLNMSSCCRLSHELGMDLGPSLDHCFLAIPKDGRPGSPVGYGAE